MEASGEERVTDWRGSGMPILLLLFFDISSRMLKLKFTWRGEEILFCVMGKIREERK